jgi:hypothetical protein
MPRLEEVAYYIQGLWLLLKGKPEAFGYLDFSERGFWRSWWSLLYSLPPLLLIYAARRDMYLSQGVVGTEIGNDFFFKMAALDLAATVFATIALFVVARLGGFREQAPAIIIVTNWLGVPLIWMSSIQNLIQLYVPGSEIASAIAELIYFSLTVYICTRLINRLVGGNSLVTASSVLTLFIVPIVSGYYLADVVALVPGS